MRPLPCHGDSDVQPVDKGSTGMRKRDSVTYQPMNLPTVGDTVRLRGRGAVGVLRQVITRNNWSFVKWEPDKMRGPMYLATPGHPARFGPVICHLFELETLRSATQEVSREE